MTDAAKAADREGRYSDVQVQRIASHGHVRSINDFGRADFALHTRKGTGKCYVEFRTGGCVGGSQEFGTDVNRQSR